MNELNDDLDNGVSVQFDGRKLEMNVTRRIKSQMIDINRDQGIMGQVFVSFQKNCSNLKISKD